MESHQSTKIPIHENTPAIKKILNWYDGLGNRINRICRVTRKGFTCYDANRRWDLDAVLCMSNSVSNAKKVI